MAFMRLVLGGLVLVVKSCGLGGIMSGYFALLFVHVET
jgi:hypothetical protein